MIHRSNFLFGPVKVWKSFALIKHKATFDIIVQVERWHPDDMAPMVTLCESTKRASCYDNDVSNIYIRLKLAENHKIKY